MPWSPGEVIVERQIWHGVIGAAFPTIVIEDTIDHVVTYMAPGAPFGFVDEVAYPSPSGRHPRYGISHWQGHGMLAVTPKSGCVAVQHYWTGPEREFASWYLNLQEPMRPTPIGFDTQDLELDFVITPDRRWTLKDDELLDQRVVEGRWTPSEADAIRQMGARVASDVLDAGQWWWDTSWSDWKPVGLEAPALLPGWADVPVPAFDGVLCLE